MAFCSYPDRKNGNAPAGPLLNKTDPNYQTQLATEQEYIDSVIATIELYQHTTDSIQRDLYEIMADRGYAHKAGQPMVDRVL